MPLIPVDPSLFSLPNLVADAIALANMVLDYWMYILGMGLGTAIMAKVFQAFRRAIP